MKKHKHDHTTSRSSFIKIAKLHVLAAALMGLQIVVYDASKLITPEVVLKRWIYAVILIIVAGTCWYFARLNQRHNVIKNLAWTLILTDIIIGALIIYGTRGMSSRGIILFVLPILVAGAMHRMGMIFLTAILTVCGYIVAALSYFVLNFNEGYKVELYGEVFFYSSILILIAAMVWSLVKHKH